MSLNSCHGNQTKDLRGISNTLQNLTSVQQRVDISKFYLINWLHNICDVINTKTFVFLETNKINQFMQFSIDSILPYKLVAQYL